MRDDMTLAEAEAYREGWMAAREAAAAIAEPTDGTPGDLIECCLEIATDIRRMRPPAPPARTRIGILGEG